MRLKTYQNPLIIFFFLSIIFTFPLFLSLNKIGIVAWDHIFYYEAPRISLLEYHQFPFWNPYYCGGNVLFSHPESVLFSPFFLFVILFNTLIGVKIAITAHLFFGLITMYILARQFKLTHFASYVAAFVYMFNSQFIVRMGIGNFPYIAMAFYPLAFFFFLKGLKQKKYEKHVIFSAVFIILAFFTGAVYEIAFFLLFMGIYALFKCLILRKLKPLTLIVFIFLFIFLLASIKLIPVLDFVHDNPRDASYSADESTSLKEFADDLLKSVRLSKYYAGTPATPDDPRWWEGSMGLGIIGTLLIVIGVFFCFKREKALVFTTFTFILIFLGDTIPISLWKLLHLIPPFDSFYVIGRLSIILVFTFALLAGFGFSGLEIRFDRKKFNHYLFVGLIILLLGSLFFMNFPILKDALQLRIPPLEQKGMFSQTVKNYSYNGVSYAYHYLAIQENRGDLTCLEEIRPATSVSAMPKESDLYKGEAYLKADGQAEIVYFSPNKIVVEVNSNQENLLILNQNYETNWRVKPGHVENYHGLLATKVPKGDTTLTFYYFPNNFIIGIFFSVVSLVLVYFFIKRYSKRLIFFLMLLLVISALLFIYSSKETIEIPEIYNQMKMDPEQYAIIDIPFTSPLFHAFRYYAEQHNKEVVWHHPSQKISYKVYLLKKIFFANDVIDDKVVSDVLVQNPQKIALSVLNYYDVKKVFLHKKWYGSHLDWLIFSKPFPLYDYSRYKDWYGNEYYNKTKRFLDETLEKSYEDEEVIIYDMPEGRNKQIFGLMEEGWYGYELTRFNWMGDEASIKIISPKETYVQLKFKAFNFYETKTLEIYKDGSFIGSYKIDGHKEIVTNLKLKNGENKLEFKSKEKCKKPFKVSESKDQRCLNIAISDLEIIE